MMQATPRIVDVERLLSFLDRMQSAFLSERLDEVMEAFALPLPVYSVAGLQLVRERDEFKRLLEAFRRTRATTESSKSDLLSVEPIVNDRFRAVVDWQHFDADGEPVGTSQVRYFIHLPDNERFAIEMIEFLVLPITLDDVETIIH